MADLAPMYSDCPAVEATAVVDAPVPAVWSMVTDIGLPARFSPEVQGAEWLDDATGPAVGARFLGRNRHPVAGTWQTLCTIVDYEHQRRLAYVVTGPPGSGLEDTRPAATWRFELEPGGSRSAAISGTYRSGPVTVEPGHRRRPGGGTANRRRQARGAAREHGGDLEGNQGPGRAADVTTRSGGRQ